MRGLYESNGVPLFLILDLNFWNPVYGSGKIKNLGCIKGKKIKSYPHYQKRIIEDLSLFISSGLFFTPFQDTFIILKSQEHKWAVLCCPRKTENPKQKDLPSLKVKKNYFEEILIYDLEKEMGNLRGLTEKRSLVSSFYIIFYALNEIGFNKRKNKSFRILSLVQKENFYYNLNVFKKLISIGKKMRGTFDSFILLEESFFLNTLAFRTTGVYCKPSRFLTDLMYCSDFLQVLMSLFLLNTNRRQFFGFGFPVKIPKSIILEKERKEGWCCCTCFSSFFFPLTDCYLCGASFF